MHVVFCSVGLRGHLNPLVPFVEAARDRGDDVTVVVPPALVDVAGALGVTVEPCAAPPQAEVDDLVARVPHVSKAESVLLLDGELFGRLSTTATLPTVRSLCERRRVDLLVRETCSYAPAIVGVQLGIAHAQVGISTAAAEWGLTELIASTLERFEPDLVNAIRTAPYLTRFPDVLDPSPFPRTMRYRVEDPDTGADGAAPWAEGDEPLLYVTLGTVAGTLDSAVGAFRVVLDAVTGLGVRILVTTGESLDPAALGPLPPDTFVERYVPQAAVFRRAFAVVCHGGSGTTYGAIAAGLPIVFVPMFADQFTNAALVSDAGAGRVAVRAATEAKGIRPIEADDTASIRDAVREVLGDPSIRRAAEKLASRQRAVENAPSCLDRLVAQSRPPSDD